MKINFFSVVGLHGVIDAEMDFYDDLTVIVGMNGSGKTSILTLISDIVRFDTGRLLATQFSSARLGFFDEESRYSVALESDSAAIKVSVIRDGQEFKSINIPKPIKSDLNSSSVPWIYKSFGIQEAAWLQNSLFVDFANDESAIRGIFESISLTFLRVDRTLAASDASGNISIEESGVRAAAALRGLKAEDPLDVVLRVTTQHYTEYKNNLEKIRTKAYQSSFSLSFSDDLFQPVPGEFTVERFERNINQLEREVKRSSAMPKDESLLLEVERYFKDSRALLKIVRDERSEKSLQAIEGVLKSRQSRIAKLLKIFEIEQKDTKSAYAKIDKYIKTLNSFFLECGKRLEFDEKTNVLGFSLVNKRYWKRDDYNRDGDRLRSLSALSSGERQILIVITYLCFITKSPGIYIIDEPELSLHLTWQRRLLEGLNAVKPEESQIVLATHTPEIVGYAPDKLVILNPAYHDDEGGEGVL
ncbi:AAA family ATPase [Burkholderia sp. HI2500]|uniref:AAA family ATPase n=1 Tax=Burkholderia sp. HI2500 TaxID=2015358 RepID=UPI000B7A407C|nr:AAA family ATPase [Burkholderia sp. HI2500]OXJ10510.1 hypothetical protein CFB45_26685 [Burkholderia sp. HI2500]